MVTYNLSKVMGSNSTIDVIKAINTELTGGLYIILTLVALFVILIMYYERIGLGGAFLVTSFMVSVFAGLFWLAGLLPLYILLICLVLPLIGVFLTLFTGQN